MSDRVAEQIDDKFHTCFNKSKITPTISDVSKLTCMPVPGCCAANIYVVPDDIDEENVKQLLKHHYLKSMTILLGNVPKFATKIDDNIGVIDEEAKKMINKAEKAVAPPCNTVSLTALATTNCRETEFKSIAIGQVTSKVYVLYALYYVSEAVLNHIVNGLEEGDVLLAIASGNGTQSGILSECGMELKHRSPGSYGDYKLHLHYFRKKKS